MTTTATPARTADAHLLGLRVAHRMMCRDARRLAELALAWADGTQAVTGRRARAFVTWTGKLCTEIHHHHAVEDDALLPVLERLRAPRRLGAGRGGRARAAPVSGSCCRASPTS